jgi:hypothetical protein
VPFRPFSLTKDCPKGPEKPYLVNVHEDLLGMADSEAGWLVSPDFLLIPTFPSAKGFSSS